MSLKVVFVFLLAAIVLKGSRGQCPANATLRESCYVIPMSEANWIGAQRYCNTMGGNLATIDSTEEHNFIVSLINSVQKQNVSKVQIHTADDYVYHYMEDMGVNIHGHSSASFMVQACHDAHLALSATKNSDQTTYEVVIGGWSDSQSVIRDCKQCAHMDEVRQQDHPLSCNEQRPFWVSWQDGVVTLGTGSTVGEQVMLTWSDPHPHPVNHLAVATGFGSDGVWHFNVTNYQPGVFWLGMTDLQVEGEWTSLPFLEEVEFTHWAPGQPSGAYSRHCAALDGARDLNWIDADCESRRNFVCEIPVSD